MSAEDEDAQLARAISMSAEEARAGNAALTFFAGRASRLSSLHVEALTEIINESDVKDFVSMPRLKRLLERDDLFVVLGFVDTVGEVAAMFRPASGFATSQLIVHAVRTSAAPKNVKESRLKAGSYVIRLVKHLCATRGCVSAVAMSVLRGSRPDTLKPMESVTFADEIVACQSKHENDLEVVGVRIDETDRVLPVIVEQETAQEAEQASSGKRRRTTATTSDDDNVPNVSSLIAIVHAPDARLGSLKFFAAKVDGMKGIMGSSNRPSHSIDLTYIATRDRELDVDGFKLKRVRPLTEEEEKQLAVQQKHRQWFYLAAKLGSSDWKTIVSELDLASATSSSVAAQPSGFKPFRCLEIFCGAADISLYLKADHHCNPCMMLDLDIDAVDWDNFKQMGVDDKVIFMKADILTVDLSMYTFDAIHVAMPCETFSTMGNHGRSDRNNYLGETPKAAHANKIVECVGNFLQEQQLKNPKVLITVENPAESELKNHPIVQSVFVNQLGLEWSYLTYCFFGSEFRKKMGLLNNVAPLLNDLADNRFVCSDDHICGRLTAGLSHKDSRGFNNGKESQRYPDLLARKIAQYTFQAMATLRQDTNLLPPHCILRPWRGSAAPAGGNEPGPSGALPSAVASSSTLVPSRASPSPSVSSSAPSISGKCFKIGDIVIGTPMARGHPGPADSEVGCVCFENPMDKHPFKVQWGYLSDAKDGFALVMRKNLLDVSTNPKATLREAAVKIGHVDVGAPSYDGFDLSQLPIIFKRDKDHPRDVRFTLDHVKAIVSACRSATEGAGRGSRRGHS